eukprot:365075-Chlamydomonas_euryale.AAC.3
MHCSYKRPIATPLLTDPATPARPHTRTHLAASAQAKRRWCGRPTATHRPSSRRCRTRRARCCCPRARLARLPSPKRPAHGCVCTLRACPRWSGPMAAAQCGTARTTRPAGCGAWRCRKGPGRWSRPHGSRTWSCSARRGRTQRSP